MSDIDSKEFIEYYHNNNQQEITVNDSVYRFKGVNIINVFDKFNFLRKIGLKSHMISKIRIQCVDNTIEMVNYPHKHSVPYSFVCFLNDDFSGGELEFENITFKPKTNQLIYFTGNEKHFVRNVSIGYRYTLVCFLKEDLFNMKKNDKLI